MFRCSQFQFTLMATVLTVLSALPHALYAQQDKDNFVLSTYEVGDLIVNIQDHPYSDSLSSPTESGLRGGGRETFYGGGGGGGGMGGMGGGGGGMVGGADAPAQNQSSNPNNVTIGKLIDVIISTVSPGSWNESKKDTGKGEIQPLGTNLVVWQKQSVQNNISQLLDQLSRGSGDRKTVTIDARWLSLTSEELENLYTRVEGQEGLSIDGDVLNRYTRRSSSIRGITKCFSGQLVYLISGTRKNVVTSYIPVVGSLELPDSSERLVSLTGASIQFTQYGGGDSQHESQPQQRVGYQPITAMLNYGSLLEIRPTVMRDKTVIVDLKTTLTSQGAIVQEGSPALSKSVAPVVDRTSVETQELATTLRVKLGEATLVGGLTNASNESQNGHEQAAAAGQSRESAAELPQTYLILRVQ